MTRTGFRASRFHLVSMAAGFAFPGLRPSVRHENSTSPPKSSLVVEIQRRGKGTRRWTRTYSAMNRYPLLLPALMAFPVSIGLLWFALADPGASTWIRRSFVAAAVGAMLFSGYGVLRTSTDRYERLCVIHHADMCHQGGQGVSEFLYRYLP